MSEERLHVLLGVTGSIAAYKAVEIARLLAKRDFVVHVAMTKSATEFIAPLTFEAITGRRVITDLFAPTAGDAIAHVELAHRIDIVVVAPASANFIARMVAGMADDALAATVLATRAPMIVAPAMESGMWSHAATRENVQKLVSRGVEILGPAEGDLASGRTGLGRMLEPEDIVAAVDRRASTRDLENLGVVVTAGPTWERIDPVRFLGNRSTGAMGIAIAESAAWRGARVSLVLGPTSLEPRAHPALEVVRVESADDMLCASTERAPSMDVFIAAAAVGDFRVARAHAQKLKRKDPEARRLELEENPDILATISRMARAKLPSSVIVGFAAETEDLEMNAARKLVDKGCDMVIGNLVGPESGFGSRATEVLAVFREGPSVAFGPASKREVANFVLDQVVGLGKQRNPR